MATRARAPRPGEEAPALAGLDRRSFAAPGSREGRIGVVDAGSNSVRLVVFEGGSRSPGVVFNEKALCGLGAELSDTGRLSPGGAVRAMAALRRFGAVAEHLGVATLAGVATAAIRDAEDGPAFRDAVEAETGIRLTVASGDDEARLAAQGVLFGDPSAHGVVADLGGASLELGRLDRGRVAGGISLPLGPLRLARVTDVDAHVAGHLARAPGRYARAARRLYLVGGAWRALARADIERRGYPLKVLHEYALDAVGARALATWAARQQPADLAAMDGVSENRAPGIPLTARLLSGLLRALGPDEVVISAFGLREGVCLEAMPPARAAEDPLMAAVTAIEAEGARIPGFGAELADWVLRVLTPLDAAEARLMRASAHLADIAWRSHPDHRVAASWELATRATLTGIGHPGRVHLGLALATRYRRSRKVEEEIPALSLLDAAGRERAVALGLALRLGCSLAACAPGVLGRVRPVRAEGALGLEIDAEAAEMAGEDSVKRLGHLARHLGLAPLPVAIRP